MASDLEKDMMRKAGPTLKVNLTESVFGVLDEKDVKRYTWTTSSGFSVQVISYGATITSIKVPGVNAQVEDVVLGFDDLDGYMSKENPYFGATVGRVANRIAKGRFNLYGKEYQLAKNAGDDHLHGGIKGFNAVNWESFIQPKSNKVVFSHLSTDNDEGYPGNLLTNITFEVTPDDTLKVEFESRSDAPTIVNLTNHSYFNLGGHHSGAEQVRQHIVAINSCKYTLTDDNFIPTGKLASVLAAPYDFRIEKILGDSMSRVHGGNGFDDNFVVAEYGDQDIKFVARAVHPQSRRTLEVYCDQPGVQFYNGNNIPEDDAGAIRGKGGALYKKNGAICFETQNYPDAINHPDFPSPILNPGETYRHRVFYKFGIVKE